LTALGVTGATAGRQSSASPQAPVVAVEASAAENPSVSADGKWVVYAGSPASADDPRTSTVWLKDRESGAVTELSPIVDGVRVGNTVMPTISSDGCNERANAQATTVVPLPPFRAKHRIMTGPPDSTKWSRRGKVAAEANERGRGSQPECRYGGQRRSLGTWWAPPPSKRLKRAIPAWRVRFPSSSATAFNGPHRDNSKKLSPRVDIRARSN